VTEIVDGDTIDINNVRVRLALVNTPERGESGYTEAIDFVESVCNVGTTALVDEDDGQKEGSFDRLIGLVYCGDDGINNKKLLNELLLEHRYAVIYQDFCNISEYSSASWAQRQVSSFNLYFLFLLYSGKSYSFCTPDNHITYHFKIGAI